MNACAKQACTASRVARIITAPTAIFLLWGTIQLMSYPNAREGDTWIALATNGVRGLLMGGRPWRVIGESGTCNFRRRDGGDGDKPPSTVSEVSLT